ncbi:hypothetical protein Tco_0051284, partial [Tanacetum coccineum]
DVEVPPTTAKDIQARARERKARSTLLMGLPDVDLPKYHLIKDAKGIWDAIKTRYGEGLDKEFDRFQRFLTLLSIHGAELSTEDINFKFLRSVPFTWTNVSLIMRNKEGINDIDIDDLYNTLKAHEGDVKGTTVSSSSSLNMAFVSEEITSSTDEISTDEISTAYHVNSATVKESKHGSKDGHGMALGQGKLALDDTVWFGEEVWIFLPELVFTFPSVLRTSLGVPSNFCPMGSASLQRLTSGPLFPPVFLNKMKFVVPIISRLGLKLGFHWLRFQVSVTLLADRAACIFCLDLPPNDFLSGLWNLFWTSIVLLQLQSNNRGAGTFDHKCLNGAALILWR